MQLLISLLPLTLAGVFIACLVKLAAYLLPGTSVRWKHSFLFAGLLFGLTLARRLLAPAMPDFVPPLLAAAIGAVLVIAFGTWFFSVRAVSADGSPAGLAGGAKISAVIIGLGLAISLPLLALVSVLMRR